MADLLHNRVEHERKLNSKFTRLESLKQIKKQAAKDVDELKDGHSWRSKLTKSKATGQGKQPALRWRRTEKELGVFHKDLAQSTMFFFSRVAFARRSTN